MFLTPAAILGVWFRGLLSIVVLGAGIWLVYHWYDGLPSTIVVRNESSPVAEAGLSEWQEERYEVPFIRHCKSPL